MEIQYFEFLKHLIRFNRHVYLDHNATTNVSSHVQRKMNQVLKHHYGNPSSFYGIGRKSAEIMEQARQQVASAIHADAHRATGLAPFGAGGPHFCLGANLARREITMMFQEIFQWLPDLEITSEPDRLLSPFINGIKRMDCAFTPTTVPEL